MVLPIDDELLIEVLSDVHIIEGALQNRRLSEKDSFANIYYNQIYEKHEISEQDFVTSLQILEKDPKKLESIYKIVLERLDSLEEKSYKSKYKKNKALK